MLILHYVVYICRARITTLKTSFRSIELVLYTYYINDVPSSNNIIHRDIYESTILYHNILSMRFGTILRIKIQFYIQ